MSRTKFQKSVQSLWIVDEKPDLLTVMFLSDCFALFCPVFMTQQFNLHSTIDLSTQLKNANCTFMSIYIQSSIHSIYMKGFWFFYTKYLYIYLYFLQGERFLIREKGCKYCLGKIADNVRIWGTAQNKGTSLAFLQPADLYVLQLGGSPQILSM